MSNHRLDPLLRPRSIAVVGASTRPGSPGNEVLVNLEKGAYPGEIFLINPGRDEISGRPCYPSLSALKSVPDHVIFAVSDERLEALFDEALALGIPAATIFSSLSLPGEVESSLKNRISAKARAAGLLLHGGNALGFYNFCDQVWVSGFDTRSHRPSGNVALLSQSGAGMSGILDCDERLDFCFAASTGQELTIGVEDYLEFVLELPQTRVIGLFLETSRQPERFITALARAQEKRIPVVAIKVGKTELAAKLAVSHSGALSGSDASYQAVFDHYGVQRVEDMTELATTLIMFAQPSQVAAGSLVSLHDSGGERQLAIDLAGQLGVPFAPLTENTRNQLAQMLDVGLPAVNPLDAWGSGGEDAGNAMAACFIALLADEGAALGAVIHDRAPEGTIYPAYLDYLEQAKARTGKPVFLVANHQGSGADPLVVDATRRGIPVLDGLRSFLVGTRCLLAYRDFLMDPQMELEPGLAAGRLAFWMQRLGEVSALSESESARLLTEYGIPMNTSHAVANLSSLQSLAGKIQYPVVLKTATQGVAHKTDIDGVILNLGNSSELLSAYQELSGRLGPAALVAPMVETQGQEVLLGVSRDAQFGPVVVIATGGVQAEVLADSVSLLPPFSAAQARRALLSLRLSALLGEFRGRPALALDSVCTAAARLSVLAVELAEVVEEVDINPMKVLAGTCIGLDALVVTRNSTDTTRQSGE